MDCRERDKWMKSLCDIPYSVTRQLMTSLDTLQGWEILAAAVEYSTEKLQILALELQRSEGSPTRSLLWDLGCQNYKVFNLYEKLEKAGRRKEMTILENYVRSVDTRPSPFPSGFPSAPRSSLPGAMSYHSMQDTARKGSSPSGSELNFNYISAMDKAAAAAMPGTRKAYGDKVIPGTESHIPSLFSGISSGAMNMQGLAQSLSNNSDSALPCLPQELLLPMESCSSKMTLPSTLLPSQISGHGNISMASSMAEKLQHMIQNNEIASYVETPVSAQPVACPPNRLISNASTESNISNSSEADYAMSVKTTFTYKDLSEATGGFSQHNLVGEGAFGVVYRGNLRQMDMVIKKLKKTDQESLDNTGQLKSELTTLLKYQHENIVTLYGYALDGPSLCLVYQYLENGSLEDRLSLKNNTEPLCWERRLNIFVGATAGLHFLHTIGEPPLIHGDIKSANILLDKYFEAKIGDLGQATYATKNSSNDSTGFTHFTKADTATKQFGSKAYLPMDVNSGGQLSIKSDIYALGVVFLEILSGLKAYDPTRAGGHFLASYTKECILTKHSECDWAAEFQDKKAGTDLPSSSFIDSMKISKKCISQIKKERPTSVKLLKEVKEIYKKFCEVTKEIRPLVSVPDLSLDSSGTTISMDCNASNSAYLQRLHGVTNNDMSAQHKSLPSQLASPPLSHNASDSQPKSLQYIPSVGQSPHSKDVQYLQEERLQHFKLKQLQQENSNSVNQTTTQPHDLDLTPQYLHPQYTQQQSTELIGSKQNHTENADPTMAGICLPPEVQKMPESMRLQYLYDLQKTQSAPSLQRLNQQTLVDNDEQSNKDDHLDSISPDDYFPKADPEKLAKLMSFDDQNVSCKEQTENMFEVHPPDPKKLNLLTNWDENAYKDREQSLCDDFTKQAHTNDVTSVDTNTFDDDVNQEDQSYDQGHQSYAETTSDKQVQSHSLDRRESDVDNNAAALEYNNMNFASENKPLTKKTNSFFSKYKLERELLQDDDCDDNNTHSSESRHHT